MFRPKPPRIVLNDVGQPVPTTTGYTCSSGVCSATTVEVAGVFAGLQRQINLLLRMYNQGTQIAEDGLIGEQTVNAGGLVLSLQRRQAGGGAEWFAGNARRLTEEFSKVTRVAPDFRPPLAPSGETLVATRPPPIVEPPLSPDGVEQLPPTPDKKGIHWGWWVLGGVLLVGAGVLGYTFFKKSKGRGVSGADEYGYSEASDDFIDV